MKKKTREDQGGSKPNFAVAARKAMYVVVSLNSRLLVHADMQHQQAQILEEVLKQPSTSTAPVTPPIVRGTSIRDGEIWLEAESESDLTKLITLYEKIRSRLPDDEKLKVQRASEKQQLWHFRTWITDVKCKADFKRFADILHIYNPKLNILERLRVCRTVVERPSACLLAGTLHPDLAKEIETQQNRLNYGLGSITLDIKKDGFEEAAASDAPGLSTSNNMEVALEDDVS